MKITDTHLHPAAPDKHPPPLPGGQPRSQSTSGKAELILFDRCLWTTRGLWMAVFA
jgi:hypothetical protein